MQQLHVSEREREKDKETDSLRKTSRERLWRRRFDVQIMSLYTLSDPFCHFCAASASEPHLTATVI